MPFILLEIPFFTFSQIFRIFVFMLFIMLDILVFIPLNILLTVFLMPFKIGVRKDTIAFQTVVMKFLTFVKTVEIVVNIAVHIVL